MAMYFTPRLVSPKKTDYPFTRYAELVLASWNQNERGDVTLSPQLMTPEEVDHFVDGLVEELQRFRKAAKNGLRNKSAA